MSEFSNKITNLRENKGWSKTYVAKAVGLNNLQTYANYEYGIREPDQETIVRLANLYNVTTDYLLGNESTPKWAEKSDVLELHDFLNSNAGMAFEGVNLSSEQKQRVNEILTQVFWDEIKKEKNKKSDDNHE